MSNFNNSNSNNQNLQLTLFQLKAVELKRKAAEINRKIQATIQAAENTQDEPSECKTLERKEVEQDSESIPANQTVQESEFAPNFSTRE